MKMNDDKYIKASLRERYLLNDLHKHQDFDILTITKATGYEKYDAVISSGNTEMIVEIKVRFSDLNLNWGYMIQKEKYDYLMEQNNKFKLKPVYINFFESGTLIWDLSTFPEPQWKETLYPSNSMDMNADNKLKIEADLTANAAMHIKIKNNITEATLKAHQNYARNEQILSNRK